MLKLFFTDTRKNKLKTALILAVLLFGFFFTLSLACATVKLEVISPSKATSPGRLVTHVFSTTNEGTQDEIYEMQITLPPGGWRILAPLSPINLMPQETKKIFLTIFVPPLAAIGEYKVNLRAVSKSHPQLKASNTALAREYEIKPTATSQTHHPTASASATATIVVKEFARVKVNALSEEKRVKEGEEVSYSFLIINRGNAVDKFKISADSAHTWKINLSEELIRLAPGEQKEVSLTLLVPKDTPGGRKYFTLLRATSLRDESAFDSADISTTILPPPPERVGGILSRQVPANVSLFGCGSITKGEYYGGSISLNAGGDLKKGRWFNVYSDASYSGRGIKEPHLRLDYGVKDRWDLSLGDVSADFSELTELRGEGARIHTRLGRSSDFSLIWAKEEEKGRYGTNLSRDIGQRTNLGLNYFTSSEEDISSLQLNHNFTKKWDISGEYAVSEGKENSDRASWISSKFEGKNLILDGEYIKAGTNYLGSRRDEEGARISSQYHPFKPLLLGLFLQHSNNNVNEDPTLPRVITDVVNVSPSLDLKGLPFLRLGYNTTKQKSKGPPPFTDEEETKFSAGISDYLRPFAYFLSREWGKKNNYTEGTEFDLIGYEGTVSAYLGRLSTWFGYAEDIELEVTKKTKEKSMTQEVGLEYEIIPGKFSAFIGWAKRQKEETTETISLGTNFRLGHNTYLSLGVEREEAELGEVDWKANFSLGRSFGLPIPWDKTKGRIEGFVFIDKNKNGSLDEDEEGIRELILTANGMQAITGKKGEFRFPPLEPRDYEVNLEDIPAGLKSGIALPRRISLTAGKIVEVNIPLVEASSIVGVVFGDKNKNGVRDKGEVGIPRVRVILASERAPQETFTNSNGRFFFTVSPGEHRIRIDKSSLPERYVLTTEGQYSIALAARERASVSFGARYKPREIIITFQPPCAHFSFDPRDPKSGETVTLDASSSSAFSGKIVKYEWDFDNDGKIDTTGKIVDHVFSSVGDYPITLRVTDEGGATDSRTKTVIVE